MLLGAKSKVYTHTNYIESLLSVSASVSAIQNSRFTVYINSVDFANFISTLKYNQVAQNICILDAVCIDKKLVYTLTATVGDDLLCCVVYQNNSKFLSTSTILSSCVWLERELSEFNVINFVGLVDTRRLLLDYTIQKGSVHTHTEKQSRYTEVSQGIKLFIGDVILKDASNVHVSY